VAVVSVPAPTLVGMADPAEDHTPGGAARDGTRVDGVDVLGALSPSRAGDFKTCALKYRFRTIDRLPEEPSPDALRGTVVHKVLEDLFDLPAADRTPARAEAMVEGAWEQVVALEPEVTALFDAEPEGARPFAEWLDSCRVVLRRYFDLEDPRRLEPAAREAYVETLLDSKVLLRGVVDRLDVAADGAIRVVDYKTGRAAAPGLEGGALFQMRFYALVIWRTRRVLPAMLRLIYLGDGTTVSYVPDEADLRATERQLEALWRAVALAHETGEWLPRRGRHCTWCSFQALCPEFGGTPPPLPGAVAGSEGEDASADLAGGRLPGAEHQGVGA
jgi:putative RecB family exonuclease